MSSTHDATVGIRSVGWSQDSVRLVCQKMNAAEMSVPGFKKHVLMDPQQLNQLEEMYKEQSLLTQLVQRQQTAEHPPAKVSASQTPAEKVTSRIQIRRPDCQETCEMQGQVRSGNVAMARRVV